MTNTHAIQSGIFQSTAAIQRHNAAVLRENSRAAQTARVPVPLWRQSLQHGAATRAPERVIFMIVVLLSVVAVAFMAFTAVHTAQGDTLEHAVRLISGSGAR